jgi:HAMP domain-containing protein
MATKALTTLLLAVLVVFAAMFVFLNILLWFVVIRPIKRLSAMADQVSSGNLEAEEVAVSGSDEVSVLAGSFNRMRISLTKALSLLEDS